MKLIATAVIALITLSSCSPNPRTKRQARASIDKPMVQVQLAGSAEDDGLPAGRLTLQWSMVSGPESVQFQDPSAANSWVTFSAAGEYVLRLTATDGALIRTDDVLYTITE